MRKVSEYECVTGDCDLKLVAPKIAVGEHSVRTLPRGLLGLRQELSTGVAVQLEGAELAQVSVVGLEVRPTGVVPVDKGLLSRQLPREKQAYGSSLGVMHVGKDVREQDGNEPLVMDAVEKPSPR